RPPPPHPLSLHPALPISGPRPARVHSVHPHQFRSPATVPALHPGRHDPPPKEQAGLVLGRSEGRHADPASDRGQAVGEATPGLRSEEHTSELPSLTNLVC